MDKQEMVLFSHIEPLLLESKYEFPKPKVDGTLQFIGKAVRDEVLANNLYLSRDFNDHLMQRTNEFINSGGRVTIFPRHGDAIPPPLGTHPTGIPTGRVLELFRLPDVDPDWVFYAGEILPTSKGKDLQTLILGDAMTGTSIRSTKIKSEMREMEDGVRVRVPFEGYVEGIDFADDPAILGAGVVELLESPVWREDADEDESEERDMEKWDELTLEALQENRQDIFDAIQESARATLLEQISEMEGSVADLTKERDSLKQSLAELGDAPQKIESLEQKVQETQVQLESVEGKLSDTEGLAAQLIFEKHVFEAAEDQLTKLTREHLTELCETEDQIEDNLAEAQDRAYIEFAASRDPRPVNAKGETHDGDEDAPQPKTSTLSAEQQEVLNFL